MSDSLLAEALASAAVELAVARDVRARIERDEPALAATAEQAVEKAAVDLTDLMQQAREEDPTEELQRLLLYARGVRDADRKRQLAEPPGAIALHLLERRDPGNGSVAAMLRDGKAIDALAGLNNGTAAE